MSIKGLLNFYRECFKEDSADFNLRNLQRLNKEDLLLLKGIDEIASGNLHRLPISPEYGESFAKRSEMYQRERVLLHCSLFVVGKFSSGEDQVTVFSPLVLNEAKIESDEYGYYFTAEKNSLSINEELLSLLLPNLDSLPDIELNRVYDPAYWSALLEQSPFNIKYLDSLRFPKLDGKEEVNKAIRRKTPNLLAISTLVFVERSASSRGVLHELFSLLERDTLSAPLQALIGNKDVQRREVQVNQRLVPALLSQSQREVLEIAATQTLGAVSGPPGTGKSYTIAAVAAEHFTRSESVLIVAGSETALDVIAEKLSKDFGLDNLYVRAGQKSFLREFKQYLDDLLAGYYDFSEAEKVKSLQNQVELVIQDIKKDEQHIHKLSQRAIKLGNRSYKINTGTASLWDKCVYKFSSSLTESLKDLWDIQSHFNQLLERKEKYSTDYLRAAKAKSVSNLLKQDRKTLQTLNRAVRARTSAKQAEYFASANFNILLNGFPVWLVSLNSLHKVLPLQQEMFDLVIVDEATQCNISSTLPALERAKRALIVGDQKQLKHFSFLPRSKERQIAKDMSVADSETLISYRDNSVLDLAIISASKQKQIAFLDEHFRSQPELIHFSNQSFYSNKLKVMQHRPCSVSGHIHIVRIKGERAPSGFNILESAAVLEKIQEIIEAGRQTGITSSIGVLSPFSKQVKHMSQQIEANIQLDDIKRHNIKVATPYGFQGEERDVMLLSFSIDNNSLRAAAYLNKPDVFNVSVTRARHKQYVYISIDETNLSTNNLLKQYLSTTEQFFTAHDLSQQPDEFQSELAYELNKHGIECWCGYEMLGTYIDILGRYRGQYVAIDLIGYPGPWADHFELSTYKVIKRAGINVFPLSYALWLKSKTDCIEAIKNMFDDGTRT